MQRVLNFLRSPFGLIGLVAFVDALGFAITVPVFPLYAKELLGASPAEITGVQAAYFFMSFLMGPLLGRLSDRFGRRPILIISQLGSLLSYVVIAFAPNIWIVYVARMLDGITAGNFSTAQAYISDITEPGQRVSRLGMTALAFSLGLAIGPALGGIVASALGPRAAYACGALIATITITLTALRLKESLTAERRSQAAAHPAARSNGSTGELVRLRGVLPLLVIAFFAQFAFFCFQTVFVLWSQAVVFPGQPTADVSRLVSYVLALMGLVGIVVQLRMLGPLVRRFGERRLLVIGLVSRACFCGLLLAAPFAWMLPTAAPLLAFGSGVLLPSLAALQTYAAPARRGQILGLNQSAASLGSVLGPLVGGQLFERVTPSAPIGAALGLTLVALIVALLLQRTTLGAARPTTPPPSPAH
ncbi:MAG: MFS transporter [Thermoflexales bacterium]|nr:MFS transporter [Thermoflexales bacterium]